MRKVGKERKREGEGGKGERVRGIRRRRVEALGFGEGRTDLILSSISDETFGVGEGDVGRSGSVSLVVGYTKRDEQRKEESAFEERRWWRRVDGWDELRSFSLLQWRMGLTDDLDSIVLPDSDAGVGGSEIDSDS